MRKGITLIEVLVILAIIGVLAALLIPVLGGFHKDPLTGKSYYNVTNTKTYRCVKTYTTGGSESSSTSKRVDLKEIQDGKEVGPVQTFEVNDSFRIGVDNSGTLYAQFEAGKYYRVTSVGFRKEGWNGFFPLVKSVSEVPDPTVKPIKAEVNEGDFDN